MAMTRRQLALAGLAAAAECCAWAEDYPVRPVKIVIPYPPGGASDVTARLLADRLTALVHVPVVAENKPGANGNLAAEAVAKAAPDGYTLLMANVGPNAINQGIYDKLPYDNGKSFAPVRQTTLVPIVLVAGPALKATNIADLLLELRAAPGKHSYASAGNGASNHLAGALFANLAGLDLLHVPYRGDGPALTDVMAGQVSMMFATVVSVMPHLQSGKLRALALATNRKVPALTTLPTLAEAGVKDFDAASWGGIVAPAGTPDAVVQWLYRQISAVLVLPDVRSRLTALGAEIVDSSPAQFGAYIRSETEKWARVARGNGIRADN